MFGIAGTVELGTICPGTGTWNRLQDGNIPRDLISQEEFQGFKSRPDIILYRRRQIRKTPEGQWRTTPAVVTLVEIKYTRDTDPSRTMRDPFTARHCTNC